MEIQEQERTRKKPNIGITIGDFNGVGPELIISILQDTRINNICTPIIYGSGKILTKYKRLLDVEQFNYHQYNPNSYLNEKKPNVINCWQDNFEISPGKVTKEAGKCAFLALEKATEDLKSGFIDGLVTCPINKSNIQSDEFKFPGHTEYLATKLEVKENLMLLCSDSLRVAVVTGHVPVSKIKITKEAVHTKLTLLYESLKKDFGISRPKIAVLGLNPHAGEDGLLGSEDKEIIQPVVTEFHKKGKLVYGPFPADGFFGMYSHTKFDGVLAMYHDQGLIPFKTLAFEKGVNFTAGMPAVRTSPDHGTAYDIAGKGKASDVSLREAIYTACDIYRNRTGAVKRQLRVKPRPERREKKERY